MKTSRLFALVVPGLFAAGSLGTSVLGCAAPAAAGCTSTPFITPTTVTLDHSVAGNSQLFTTGVHYSGSCVLPATAFVPGYTWQLSDTIDATVSTALGPGATVSCVNAAPNPITVSTALATSPAGSSPTAPPTYIPSGLPSATLICK